MQSLIKLVQSGAPRLTSGPSCSSHVHQFIIKKCRIIELHQPTESLHATTGGSWKPKTAGSCILCRVSPGIAKNHGDGLILLLYIIYIVYIYIYNYRYLYLYLYMYIYIYRSWYIYMSMCVCGWLVLIHHTIPHWNQVMAAVRPRSIAVSWSCPGGICSARQLFVSWKRQRHFFADATKNGRQQGHRPWTKHVIHWLSLHWLSLDWWGL